MHRDSKHVSHRVVIYLFLVSHSVCFSRQMTAGEANYNRRVIGRRKKSMLHRAVSLR